MSAPLPIRLYQDDILVFEEMNNRSFIPDIKYAKDYCISYLNQLYLIHNSPEKMQWFKERNIKIPSFDSFNWIESDVNGQRNKFRVQDLKIKEI